MSWCDITRAALLGSLACAMTAHAVAADDAWILNAGGEMDDEEGYRFDAGVAWIPTERTSVSAYAGRADLETDFDQFASNVASLALDHNFDPVGFSVEARWRSDSEFLEALTWGGSIYFKRGLWRFALRGESRGTDFAPQSFEDVIITRQGVPILVSATSECSLDDTAYGAAWSYAGKVWSGSLSGTQYDYSDADCEFTNVSPPSLGLFLRLHPDLLPLIAPRLAAFQRLQRSSVTRESTFLDYTVSFSLGIRDGERSWELDYFHDREQFQELESDTVVLSVLLPVGERSDVELRVGVTDSDLSGSVAFAGFTLFAYLGGL